MTLRIGLTTSLTLLLMACGSSPESSSPTQNEITVPPRAPGESPPPVGPPQSADCNDPSAASMPATPSSGNHREGLSCGIYIPMPVNAEIPGTPTGKIAIQVIEPTNLVGGQTYPLILEGHGFSGSRQRSPQGLIKSLTDAGYGVISIDQTGHGETDGIIRGMDPDYEGQMLITILDWAEANLDWLAYGPDADFGGNNLVLGAIGGSYGGAYQQLIQNIDPKKRLDAIVPAITWHDLSYSIFPNNVPKTVWGSALFGAGNSGGDGANFDPFVTRFFQQAITSGRASQPALDYFRYHSMGYFCDGNPVPSGQNGDDGNEVIAGTPYNVDYQPNAPTQVHALYIQGMRDALFNFNEAFWNYNCMRQLHPAMDIRLMTYQTGHNALQLPPDPYASPENSLIGDCNSYDQHDASLAFFNLHLKGDNSGVANLPGEDSICLSLHGADALEIPRAAFPDGQSNGTSYAIPTTPILTGASPLTPAVLPWTLADGDSLAGIPRASFNVECFPACPQVLDPNNIVFFVGVGVNVNGQWQLADNQVLPVRGLGPIEVDLIGIGEKLQDASQIGLLLFGSNDQFQGMGGQSLGDDAGVTINISGSVSMPVVNSANF